MRTPSILAAFAASLLVTGAGAQVNETDPSGVLGASQLGSQRALGDLIAGPFDVETAPFDNRCLGVEEAWGHFWVTGRGHSTVGDVYMIHKFDMNGVYVASYPQNVSTVNLAGWGGRDMEADDATNTLWVGNDNGYVEVMTYDPVTGGLVYGSTVVTGVTGTVRALCQNTATGNFFTKSFTSPTYEFDMATGAVVNTFTNTAISSYGMGYDANKGTIWSTDATASVTEMDPATGLGTGVGFGTALGGSQGGADVYSDSRNPNGLSVVTLHQATPDQIAVYDTVGAPPPPFPNLPASFVAAAGYFDDFESYGGVLPGHMAENELDAASGAPDPEAYVDIAGSSGLGAYSGTACLEMGLLPTSNNYHDVRNALVLGMNGAGASALELDFQAIDHGEETDTWDGVFLSEDGVTWTQAYGPWTALVASWQPVSVGDISGLGVNTNGDFYLLFGQDDNFPYGYLDGLGVDDINIVDPPPPGPNMAITGLTAGNVATISVSNCTAGGLVRTGYSLVGGGPTSTPFGDLLLSPPYSELPGIVADAAGSGSLAAPVPPGTTGVAVWLHGLDLGSLTFLNGLAEVIG
jgi:hypothetical protein